MSIHATSSQSRTESVRDPVLRLAFVGNVHRMLALGYEHMEPAKYHDADENLLTQQLVVAMRDVVASADCPRWAVHFNIQEKQRQNDGHLEGNKRFELDIVLERTQRGPRPTFVIEAKRLGLNHPVSAYLGPDGLGAFVSCEYAGEHDDAGMLGYVQARTMSTWCDALKQELGAPQGKRSVDVNGMWRAQAFRNGPACTHCSRHTRSGRGMITIYHTLLDFTQ